MVSETYQTLEYMASIGHAAITTHAAGLIMADLLPGKGLESYSDEYILDKIAKSEEKVVRLLKGTARKLAHLDELVRKISLSCYLTGIVKDAKIRPLNPDTYSVFNGGAVPMENLRVTLAIRNSKIYR